MNKRFKACIDSGKVILIVPPNLVTKDDIDQSFRDVLKALLADGFKDIILDFSNCNYVDSHGLGALVSSYALYRREGGSLVLNRLTRKIRDLMVITKLITVFDLYEVDYSRSHYIEFSSDDLTPLKNRVALPEIGLLNLLFTINNGRIQLLPGKHEGIYRVILNENTDSELLLASPYIIANTTRSYLQAEIEEFESLINSPNIREQDVQKFLETHPKFLLGQEYQKLYPQVVMEREDDGALIPDFLLQPFNKQLCDIVDLKLPTSPLIVGGYNRRRFSSAISDAAAQLRTYRDYFDDPKRREIVRRRYGITAYRPKLAVIVSRSMEVDEIHYRQMQDGLTNVEVITYDDLIKRAKSRLLL